MQKGYDYHLVFLELKYTWSIRYVLVEKLCGGISLGEPSELLQELRSSNKKINAKMKCVGAYQGHKSYQANAIRSCSA